MILHEVDQNHHLSEIVWEVDQNHHLSEIVWEVDPDPSLHSDDINRLYIIVIYLLTVAIWLADMTVLTVELWQHIVPSFKFF
jgi:hypothetical protein